MQNYNYSSQQIQQHNPTQVHQIENNQYNQETKSIQYPPLNQNKETLSIDNQQSEEIISSDYLQQLNQGYHPTRQQELTQQLIQPLIHPIQPTVTENEYKKITWLKRRVLIMKINVWMIVQQCMQIALSILSLWSQMYDNLFFDYSNNEYRLTGLVILVITFVFLLIVRFGITIKKTKDNQCIYYAIFCLLYSFLVSSVVSAGNSPFEDQQEQLTFYFGVFYFSGSILGQIVLFQVHFQILSFKDEQMKVESFVLRACCGSICIFLFISVLIGLSINDPLSFYVIIVLLFFMMIWSLVFTLFYISSLLQIFYGKFKLREDQYFIGSVLTYVNMLFLYI